MALAFISSALVALMGFNGDINYRPNEDETIPPPSLFFRSGKNTKTNKPDTTSGPYLTGILFVFTEAQTEKTSSQCWINGDQFAVGDMTPWGKIQKISRTTVTLEAHTTLEPRILSLQP